MMALVTILKSLHIAAMLCWCAALIALPLLLYAYGRARDQSRYSEFRLITHYGYIGFATPAAVIAISAGTGLAFAAADVFVPWFAAKLAFVCVMALAHAYVGYLIEQSGIQGAGYRMPSPLFALFGAVPAMMAVLWLVLAKPELVWVQNLIPDFLQHPMENPLIEAPVGLIEGSG
ncbi:MAG: hypothetical protein DI498_04315 [Paracoccus denitrificans]|nr:MAG: hypothetical protein DI498_04315 [Paracoccus denitrificans]PZO85164.1 MAG: hypothetical protein DI633_04315 [Paracoccus denitrificans]